jgi:hypothetical protein
MKMHDMDADRVIWEIKMKKRAYWFFHCPLLVIFHLILYWVMFFYGSELTGMETEELVILAVMVTFFSPSAALIFVAYVDFKEKITELERWYSVLTGHDILTGKNDRKGNET